jgi:hypothetical protein
VESQLQWIDASRQALQALTTLRLSPLPQRKSEKKVQTDLQQVKDERIAHFRTANHASRVGRHSAQWKNSGAISSWIGTG